MLETSRDTSPPDTEIDNEIEKALYAKAIWLIENGYVEDTTVEDLVEKLHKLNN